MIHDALVEAMAGLPTDGRLLLRPSEVADALALGRTTVYGMIHRGELPTVRIGSAVRVPVDALREWVERRTLGG